MILRWIRGLPVPVIEESSNVLQNMVELYSLHNIPKKKLIVLHVFVISRPIPFLPKIGEMVG